jgi:hypothetical protein
MVGIYDFFCKVCLPSPLYELYQKNILKAHFPSLIAAIPWGHHCDLYTHSKSPWSWAFYQPHYTQKMFSLDYRVTLFVVAFEFSTLAFYKE